MVNKPPVIRLQGSYIVGFGYGAELVYKDDYDDLLEVANALARELEHMIHIRRATLSDQNPEATERDPYLNDALQALRAAEDEGVTIPHPEDYRLSEPGCD